MLSHLGFTFTSVTPATMWTESLPEKSLLEHTSASIFSEDGTHWVRIFIDILIIYKCVPCAHLSNGALGHLAESSHAFAVILSRCKWVIFPTHDGEKVSHVIKAATNSAMFIFMWRGCSAAIGATLFHSSQLICQKRPEWSLRWIAPLWKRMTPAMPKDVDASLNITLWFSGNRPNT